MRRTRNPFFFDFWVAGCFLGLLGFGLVLTLATSPDAANRFDLADPYYFAKRQMVFAIMAVLTFAALTFMGEVVVRRLAFFSALIGLLALGLVLFVGKDVNGSQRWLDIAGFAVQPSEFMKPCLVVTLAWVMSRHSITHNINWLFFGACVFITCMGLLLLQPDVGQTFLLAFGTSVVVYSFGLRLRYLMGFAVGCLALLSWLYLAMPHVRNRLDAFLGFTEGSPYQIKMALNGISEGGLFGMGPGAGVWKTKLPDAHTDFVFSVLAEEFGLLGVGVLVCLYAVIVLRLCMSAAAVLCPFKRASVLALTALLSLQGLINIGVNLAVLPAKGMTLPFVSYGGSSIIGCAITLGMASVFAQNRR